MAKTIEHAKPPVVVRFIELVGVSSQSWSTIPPAHHRPGFREKLSGRHRRLPSASTSLKRIREVTGLKG
jgi:hypothetical protein